MQPLAIDLFCGLGGWTEGLLAEGYYVVGFDIEQHVYGEHRYPAQLVLQDVLTLHGSQFKNAVLIVASPPCQAYSYRAMPWKRAKALPPPDNSLFDACFRIQREASQAAGRHIPLVVENVRGAQRWVGRSRWNYGSFHLWGDVPALMPPTLGREIMKNGVTHRSDGSTNFHGQKTPGFRFDGSGRSFQSESVKVAGLNWSNYGKPGYKAEAFNDTAIKNAGGSWFAVSHNNVPHSRGDAIKNGGDWFNNAQPSEQRRHGSKSKKRKWAAAMIAKIPLPLARHIARVYLP
jgi:hypothetical protein